MGAPWQRCSALTRVGARAGDARRCPGCAPARGSQALGTFLPQLFGCSAPSLGAGALAGLWMLQRGEEHSVGCGSSSPASNGADLHLLSGRAPCSAQGLGCLRSCEHQTPSAVLVWAAGEVRGWRKAAAAARHAGFSPWVPSRCCSRINGVMTAFDEMPMHHTCSYFGNALALLILPAVTGCLIRFLQLCFFFLKLSKTSAQRSAPGREVLGAPRAPVLEGGTAPWQQRSCGGF